MREHSQSATGNAVLYEVLQEARERYRAANPMSAEKHRQAAASLPGGNTRAVLWYPPFPIAMARGDGCYVEDLDGHRYVDFISEYSAALYGHSDPVIADALISAVRGGTGLGAPNAVEARYAAAIVERFPAIERVRFCNSGTEANIMAISTTRAVTGREKIVVFREGYHGGVLTFAHGGSPLNLPFPFLFADYNDIGSVEAILDAEGSDIAALIIEPMMGGGGCIPAEREFLVRLRDLTKAKGILLIFDEVMTSRLAYRGLHGDLGVNPDLVTLGKYMGGGASFGAFGGVSAIMDRYDPSIPNAFSHGGTFNNNILSMSGGLAGFTKVLTEGASLRVNALGDRLRKALNETLERRNVAGVVLGRGSLMNLHFVSGPVRGPSQLEAADTDLLALWQIEMLLTGYHVTPRGMLALSLPFRDAEVDVFVSAFDDFLAAYHSIMPARA